MTNRLDKVKVILKENISDANCGIFFSRNIVGDVMTNIYDEDGIQIDICYGWEYFEVFGLDAEEEKEIEDYYYSLGGQ